MKITEFRKLIREEVRKVAEVVDVAPNSLQGKHRNGSIIVALFFDHTKIQNNSNKLWNIVLATAVSADCTVTKYFVTDTVAEFEFRLESGGGYDPAVNTIEKGLSKVKGMVTNMDIYTV